MLFIVGGPVVACAPLIESETITLRQYGEGEVTISQTSPFEDTIISNTKNREMVNLIALAIYPILYVRFTCYNFQVVIQNSALAPLNIDCAGSASLIFNSYPVQTNTVSSDRFPTGSLNMRSDTPLRHTAGEWGRVEGEESDN